MIKKVILFFSLILIGSCIHRHTAFKGEEQPAAPDYGNEKNWCALPFRKDAADIIPDTEIWISDSLKSVDVFYVYPTLFLFGRKWNSDVQNKALNRKINRYPIKYQASVFNRVGRIYAPRYRQAALCSYTDTTGNGEKSLDFAYEDVKRAFQYYLEHYNNNRPIIIASHSQGTTHCRRLLKDFFDNPAAKKKLVCAYIIGYAVDTSIYAVLSPCKQPTETNCFVTWSSFNASYAGTGLKSHTLNELSVNPISWQFDTVKAVGEGGILFNLNRKKQFKTEAFVKEKNLWVKTNIPVFKHMRNMHVLDYNLFWFDIRKNVSQRVQAYFETN